MISAILIFSLALRLISINQSFWLDEATTGLVSRMSLSEVFNLFLPGDFHPPLYYVLTNFWGRIFGTGEISLRMVSVIAGVASVYFVYKIAERLVSKEAGVFSSLLLATSGLHLYYSQEARMYSLATALVTATLYFFLKLKESEKGSNWLTFSLLLVCLSMTDYLPILVIPVLWLAAYLARKTRLWWKKFLFSHLPLVLVWGFWLSTFAKQLKGGVGVQVANPLWWRVLGGTTIKQVLLIPVKFTLGRISFDDKTIYLLVAGFAVFLFLISLAPLLKRLREVQLLLLWLSLPITVSLFAGFFIPAFSYFRLIFVLPAFYLLVGAGALGLKGVKGGLLISLLLATNLLSSFYYLANERFHRENWRDLVASVEKEKEGKEAITLFVANSQMEGYKYYSQSARMAGPEGLNSNFESIYLMRYVKDIFDPEDTLRKKVEVLGYLKTKEEDFNGVGIWRYEKQ